LKTIKKIELLAPAKNKETGKEAILHGADAVYIGVQGFSARAAAGNSVEEIAELVEFAHLYNARVYVALNTILYDNELAKVEKLIHELYRANVDALIVQDMGILQLNLPPIPLHASTQTDNRTVEKVQFLEKAGFSQVVLARELSIDEISNIASQTSVPIEVFVHGALCVSYSGQCYVSQAITKRSANRGECAQLCRLPYDLVDANGKVIRRNEHLLSLKDFNQFDNLERLLDAGAVSLKIEGRLKDVSYVKNVVAAYRQKLDAIFEKHPEFIRASSGKSTIDFTLNLSKSFNRGFTDYFSHGRQPDIWSFNSPKSIGEYIGTVQKIDVNSLTIKTKTELHNGDGLCFMDRNDLTGFRVNRAENNRIFPAQMPKINIGTKVYRNYDHDFENRLSRPTATRKIAAKIAISETPFGFALQITDEDKNHATITAEFEKKPAQKTQKENISTQLSKTGNTIFEVTDVYINYIQEWFTPSSLLGEWRKVLIDSLLSVRKINYYQEVKKAVSTSHDYPERQLTYLGNVSNEKSRTFYMQHNTQVLQPAFEQVSQKNKTLMFSKYCVKYALGCCPKGTERTFEFQEPLYLTNNQFRLRLDFDCKKCEMYVTIDN
jgi:putative protease